MSLSKLNTQIKKYKYNHNHLSEFILLGTRYSELAELAGVYLKPFNSPELPHFKLLATDKKSQVLNFLRNRIKLLEQSIFEGSDLTSNSQVLWEAIKNFDLVPCSDLMTKIKDEDVVEVHSLHDLVQMFHSFTFYSKSSYTLEEICSYPWQELYDVDEVVTLSIFKLAQSILNGEIKKTYKPQFDSYIVKEKLSHERLTVDIKYHYVSPLYDKAGLPVAAVSIETLNVLDKVKTADRPFLSIV